MIYLRSKTFPVCPTHGKPLSHASGRYGEYLRGNPCRGKETRDGDMNSTDLKTIRMNLTTTGNAAALAAIASTEVKIALAGRKLAPDPNSPAERFARRWQNAGGPELTREHKFHPTRDWRFDFAHLPSRIAIEIDGGVWIKGRHQTPSGFIGDCHKFNNCASLGWRLFRLTTDMLDDGATIPLILAAVREEVPHV